ncbi:MAG TPA: transglutaminaseTgpA domain-containing protein [Phycisphaerae bacterium]|nr:transglutaminaseTgpA domain-containing protein [Phycisphaerae bacterium]HRY71104.1 transglutaminaseTgpA domain-containing protein [Phycisphaerae bacterium]HSA29486.1 transglutaminaseTgpA domain-containing protein [Phycisphaerae bacterium]
MNGYPRLFRSQVVLLSAVAVPLAIAEDSLVRLILVVGAIGAAVLSYVWRNKPALAIPLGRILVLAAFGWLIVEYVWLDEIPVVALSHFMISFCLVKLLQFQTDRERAQSLVVCFLLLVVAAIVSGDILFFLVLVLYLTVGLRALISLHLAVERGRVDHYNRRVSPFMAALLPGGTRELGKRPAMDFTFAGAMTAIVIGAAIFVLSPRAGVGMLGHLDARDGAISVTGLGSSLSFDRISRIQTSDQEVGSVRLKDENHQEYSCPEPGPYLRGLVYDQYSGSSAGRRSGWEWRKTGDRTAPMREQHCSLVAGSASLLSPADIEDASRVVQEFRMRSSDLHVLLAMYPAIEVRSDDFESLRKNNDDQVLWLHGRLRPSIRYEIVSLAGVPEEIAAVLAKKRGRSEPIVQLPDPPLPREDRVRELVAKLSADTKMPVAVDDARWRRAYAEQICKYLGSSEFAYTLERPPPAGRREPLSAFLLDHKRGHCEYFAAAMALLCQYRGIPARVVTGYRGGDYNSLGHYYVIRQKHAHSWVEVYIPRSDWVQFDPTPAANQVDRAARPWLAGLASWRDYLQFEWANLVVSYDASTRTQLFRGFADWLRRPVGDHKNIIESVGAFIRELFWWRAELGLYNRLLYWFFAIMVLVMVVLLGYVFGVLGLWAGRYGWARHLARAQEDAVLGDAEFYRRFRRRLRSLGLRRPADQTPAEFAAELARRYPSLSDAPSVVRAYYRVAFGRGGLLPSEKAHIEAFLQRLRTLDPAQLAATS